MAEEAKLNGTAIEVPYPVPKDPVPDYRQESPVIQDGPARGKINVDDHGKYVPDIIHVDGVTVTPKSKTVTVGDTYQIEPVVTPDNATDKSVTYSSSNDNVTVNSTGKCTAAKAGTATVTVKTNDGGKTATVAFTVNEPAVSGF